MHQQQNMPICRLQGNGNRRKILHRSHMMSYNSKSCSTAQGLLLNFHSQDLWLSQTVEVQRKRRRKQEAIQEDKCVCSQGRTNESFCHPGLPNPANHLFTCLNLGCSLRRIHLKNVTLCLKLNPQRAGTRGRHVRSPP